MTDVAILEQLRVAWKRPAEEPTNAEEPMSAENRRGQQGVRRLVQSTLERINAACPSNWKPTAEDWERIDRVEATLDEARRRDDRPGLLAALADYESVAMEIFASATNTLRMAAADDKLTDTLLGIFDDLPDIPAPDRCCSVSIVTDIGPPGNRYTGRTGFVPSVTHRWNREL